MAFLEFHSLGAVDIMYMYVYQVSPQGSRLLMFGQDKVKLIVLYTCSLEVFSTKKEVKRVSNEICLSLTYYGMLLFGKLSSDTDCPD